jgi:hypothetical protein
MWKRLTDILRFHSRSARCLISSLIRLLTIAYSEGTSRFSRSAQRWRRRLEHSNENFLFGHTRAKIMQLSLLSETAVNSERFGNIILTEILDLILHST